MPTNTFKNAIRIGIGTVAQTVYVSPTNNTSICIELDVANTSNAAVTANVMIRDSSASNTSYIIKGAPVPTGSALQVISGQKIVLESGDYIQVQSSLENSIDVIASILQDV